MDMSKMPPATDEMTVTFTIIVDNVGRSRDFYAEVLGGEVALEGDEEGTPAMIKLANTWIIINVGGGPTDDKPTVTARPPSDPDTLSAFINLRVADIAKAYEEWSGRGAMFVTEPKDHGREIRAYIRDPDGYLIEVGQTNRASFQSM
jgi:catechol 2,3-dioxygenase-like lactoylglutathione lyase family enzyme